MVDLGSVVHDLVAQLGLGDILPQLFYPRPLRLGSIFVDDLKEGSIHT